MKEHTLKSARTVSSQRRRTIRQLAERYEGRVVVVRTLAGTFTGCLVSANNAYIRLRVFNVVRNRFVIIRIPYAIIFAIRLLPCRRCN